MHKGRAASKPTRAFLQCPEGSPFAPCSSTSATQQAGSEAEGPLQPHHADFLYGAANSPFARSKNVT